MLYEVITLAAPACLQRLARLHLPNEAMHNHQRASAARRDRITSYNVCYTKLLRARPKVKVGGRYRLEEGHVVVDRLQQIDFEAITAELARRSGFFSVAELLRTALHGPGRNVYLVEFHYEDRMDIP